MAGGSYGRSASLSESLTNALLIRSFAPRAMRSSGAILGLLTLGPRGGGTMVLIPRRPEICQRTTLDPKPPPLRPQNLPEDFIDRCRCKPRKPQRSGPSGAWWAYVMALLTGSPR